jgi:hypothetical protein
LQPAGCQLFSVLLTFGNEPEGGKVLAHLSEMLGDLRERDEAEHSALIRVHHAAKKWGPEKAHRELEYA